MARRDQQVFFLKEDEFQHTDSELEEYAQYLGIDLEHERDLFPIAERGLHLKLPEPWRACEADDCDHIFYFNTVTGESIWEHPNDEVVRSQVEEARAARQTLALTLTAKTTGDGLEVVATNLAGREVAVVAVPCPLSEHFSSLTEKLQAAMQQPKLVVSYMLPDGTVLGYSFRSESVATLLAKR